MAAAIGAPGWAATSCMLPALQMQAAADTITDIPTIENGADVTMRGCLYGLLLCKKFNSQA